MKRLAVVIPAYKAAFLDETLQSIAGQTCKDFAVYIGDDASPYDLRTICERWQQDIELHYHRFNNNLGSCDLVAQWERCIALSREPWVCLFCDDDLMEPECVEMFYQELNLTRAYYSIYHFNVSIIDAVSNLIRMPPEFPKVISAQEFAIKRFRLQISSFVSEYIFARKAFVATGAFQNFPFAWCSDDATWIKLANASGIRTITGPKVKWRNSGQNICSHHEHDGYEKLEAAIQYLEWIEWYFRSCSVTNLEIPIKQILMLGRNWLYNQSKTLGASFWGKGLWKSALRLHAICRESFLSELMNMFFWDFKIHVLDRRD